MLSHEISGIVQEMNENVNIFGNRIQHPPVQGDAPRLAGLGRMRFYIVAQQDK